MRRLDIYLIRNHINLILESNIDDKFKERNKESVKEIKYNSKTNETNGPWIQEVRVEILKPILFVCHLKY